MFQQFYNGAQVWVVSNAEFMGFVLAGIALAVIMVMFLALTAPVSIPYLKAKISKNKYMLLVLDKTNSVKFLSAKMVSDVVEAQGLGFSAFVKNDSTGSYSLGGVKIDVVSSGSALIHHDQYLSAIETMKRLGIESEREAAAVATYCKYKNAGVEMPANARIEELSSAMKDSDLDILVPVFNRVSLSDLGRWLTITPETIKGWCETEKDLLKKRLTRKDGSTKSGGGMSSGLLVALGVGVLAIIVVMALMKNGTM